MEKNKELLRKAFDAGQRFALGRFHDPNPIPDFDTWLSNNSAQVEALSVGNNEDKRLLCECPIPSMDRMGVCGKCNGKVIWSA